MSAVPVSLTPKWYTVAQVAKLLGYGESKVRMLIISVICARSRTVVPAGCCPSESMSTSRCGRRKRLTTAGRDGAPAQR